MIRRLIFLALLLVAWPLVMLRADAPIVPRTEKPIVDPSAYEDACQADWATDNRCRQACLAAAQCANDERGPCQNSMLEECTRKQMADEQEPPPVDGENK